MMLYHYTTIDTLALILKNKTIRFNRLDKVDDVEEDAFSNGVHLGQYIFVSCWTKKSEESIPLWKMYGGTDGVRIGLDEDMFQTYVIHDLKLDNGLHSEGALLSIIPQKDIEANDYMIMPIAKGHMRSFFYRDVEYVDDVNSEVKDAFKLTIKECNLADTNIQFGKIGRYKNKRWAFQEECRFVINVFPFNPLRIDQNMVGTICTQCYLQNKSLPFSYYDMHLRDDVINNIEITMGPNVSNGQKVIVDALCRQYTKNGKVKDSCLSGLLKMK